METTENKTKVICLSNIKIPSVYLCGDKQLSFLMEKGIIDYRFVYTMSCTAEDIRWADVVVLIRADSAVALRIAKTARTAGKYCIYVLDDDLLNVPESLAASSRHYQNHKTAETIRAVMNECQCFLSPSAVLLEKYGKAFARSEKIEEPALAGSSPISHPEAPVRIGFAGSVDRAQDIDNMLTEALVRILDQYGKRVEIVFFGALPTLANDSRVRHIHYQDSYDAYRKTMESLQWDIGLAPMPDTAFHSFKHYNKYIEYAGYGIAGIYSDVIPYRFAVRNEDNGLLVSNDPESWYAALCRLIEDQALREGIRQRAYNDAKDRFSLEKTAKIWEQVVREAPLPAYGTLPRHLNLQLSVAKVQSSFEKIREWGWKTPEKLITKWKTIRG